MITVNNNIKNKNMLYFIKDKGFKQGDTFETLDYLFWVEDQEVEFLKMFKLDYAYPEIFNQWLQSKFN